MKRIRWALPAMLAVASCALPGGPAPNAVGPPDAPAWAAGRYALAAIDDLAIVSTTVDSEAPNQPKQAMTDGNGATAWANGGYRNPTAWAQWQVGGDASFTGLAIKTGVSPAGTAYDVSVSADGQAWTPVLTNQTNTTWNLEWKAFPAPVAGKFVRLDWRNSPTSPVPHFSIYEVAVRGRFVTGGEPSPTPAPTATPSATPTGTPTSTPAPTPTPGTGTFPQFYPDLHAVPSRSFYIVSSGSSRLLRFPATLGNFGLGPMQVRGDAPRSGSFSDGFQEILDASGRVVQRQLVGQFFFHAEHHHIHLTDVSRYELRSGSPTGAIVRTASKVSFCLEDSFRVQSGNAPGVYLDCESPLMGISRTWADYYNAGLPGQEFDVAGLPEGTYYVVIVVDPFAKFLDTRRDNNTTWSRIYLNPQTGRTYATGYSE